MGPRVIRSGETGTTRVVPSFELQFIPVRESSVLQFPHAHDADSDNRDPGCIRGIRFALAIEAVAAVTIYGIWQLSHLVR